jgi:hypothetical protein
MSLPPNGRMVLSCSSANIVSFINTEGVGLFQIGRDKTGFYPYDTDYIKENNSFAVSSGGMRGNACIPIIDIVSQEFTMLALLQDNTILPFGGKEHPVIHFPCMFIFCFRFSCILSTDIRGDRLATIIWACFSFFLTKVNSHSFDLMKELTEAEKHVTAETHEVMVSLEEKQKELTEYQTNIVNIKSMHQTYKHF